MKLCIFLTFEKNSKFWCQLKHNGTTASGFLLY
jgi:hypothetical protein